jgi:hypothetical protein
MAVEHQPWHRVASGSHNANERTGSMESSGEYSNLLASCGFPACFLRSIHIPDKELDNG